MQPGIEHRWRDREWTTLALAATLFLGGCFFVWRNEPFDASKSGRVGGDQFGYCVRGFEARGWLELRGAPSQLYFPEQGAHHAPYLHHPVLPYAVALLGHRWFGENEAALRWPFAIAALLACWALWRIVAFTGGPRLASLTVTIFALQPVLLQYGNMVDSFPLALATTLLALNGWLRHGIASWRYALPAFACGLSSWYGYPLVLALWVHLALTHRTCARPWRAAFLTGLPFGLALLANLALMAWALGGFEAMLQQAGWLLNTIAGADVTQSHPDGFDQPFLLALLHSALDGATLPLLLVAAVGLMIAVATNIRRHRQEAPQYGSKSCAEQDSSRSFDGPSQVHRVMLMLLLTGLFPLLLFWSRACTHEFFMLMLAPAIALLGALVLDALILRGAALRWVAFAFAIALLSFMAWRGVQLHDQFRCDTAPSEAQALDAAFGPHDVLLIAAGDSPSGLRYYSRIILIPGLGTRPVFDWMIQQLRPATPHFKHLWLVTSERALAAMPFVRDLPVLRATVRNIPAPEPLLAVQLDRTALGL